MIISLSILYYLYLVIILIFILGSLFNIYHLLIFGFNSLSNLLIIIFYVIIASSLIMFSLQELQKIDWDQAMFDLSGKSVAEKNIFY